jgi:hypothetical protein
MFQDMLDAREADREPMETFYDGYVVNAVIDACYKSMKSGRWEPIGLEGWETRLETPSPPRPPAATAKKAPGGGKAFRKDAGEGEKRVAAPTLKGPKNALGRSQDEKTGAEKGVGRGKGEKGAFLVIKTERLPDGRTKRILKDRATGRIVERLEREELG